MWQSIPPLSRTQEDVVCGQVLHRGGEDKNRVQQLSLATSRKIPLCHVQCNKKIERVKVYMDVADELMAYLHCGRPGVVLAGGGGRGRRPDQGNGSGHSPTLPWNYSFCNEVTGFVTVTMTTLFLALRQGLESWQDAAFLGRPPPSSPPSPPHHSHWCQLSQQ